MKPLLMLLLTFLSSLSWSQDLPWPEDMYSIDSINRRFYSAFKNYFTQIKDLYPIQYIPQGFIIYDEHGDHKELEVQYQKTGDTAVVYYRAHHRNFKMEVRAGVLDDLAALAVFDMDEVLKQDNFEIHFPELNYYMRKVSFGDTTEMFYDPGWGEVFLNEIGNSKYSESRMWFNCAQCSGEPLIFKQEIVMGQLEKRYFQGDLVQQVTPQRFLEIANQWYLSSLIRQSDSVISGLKKYFPEVGD